MRPNIFEISTQELTQDGFLAWLLHWADPSTKKYNEKLHTCAVDFVNLLIHKQIKSDIEITELEVGQQWENIDVWADINKKYFIIIEDKIFSGEHSDQLERYKQVAMEWCNENNRELICIYLKTGTEAITSLQSIAEKEFNIIERSDLIDFFKNYTIKNDIYMDFVAKIENLEKAEKAFETKLIKDWDNGCWTGFYHYLDSELDISDWRYVSNPSGGFLGIWWHFFDWKKYNVYLQIEQGALCFKVGEVYKNHKKVRDEWFGIVMDKAQKKKRAEIQKPARFGSGTYMTVAKVERDVWLGNDDTIIDKEKVLARLKEYEKFLDFCLK